MSQSLEANHPMDLSMQLAKGWSDCIKLTGLDHCRICGVSDCDSTAPQLERWSNEPESWKDGHVLKPVPKINLAAQSSICRWFEQRRAATLKQREKIENDRNVRPCQTIIKPNSIKNRSMIANECKWQIWLYIFFLVYLLVVKHGSFREKKHMYSWCSQL
jgi:hypothetical protein